MSLPDDFNKIFGSAATGGLTPISDVDYTKGWEFVGANPPTKNDFTFLQNTSDLKAKWLYNNNYGRLLNCQVFTASGPYTPTPGTKTIIVEAVGAGGGGGGCAANAAGSASVGQGGGAGAYGKSRFTTGFSGVSVVIGSAGAAGAASASGTGGSGGDTSFGALLVCQGGPGGKPGASLSPPALGQSATANTSTVTGANIVSYSGQAGTSGFIFASNNNTGMVSGYGGSGPFGSGGEGSSAIGTVNAASGYGAGGGGAISSSTGSAQVGGAGSQGIVIIWEYA